MTPMTPTTSTAEFPIPDLDGFRELRIWASSFEDVQRARISCTNRMERGGVPSELFAVQLLALNTAEHQIKLAMIRSYRRVVPEPIQTWAKTEFGIGKTSPHMLARLLGALGHPRIATPYHWEGEGEDRKLIPDMPFERSLRQLWAYCGHGDSSRRKRKGMSAEEAFALGSPRSKMLVYLMAEATIKTYLPSAVYEDWLAGELSDEGRQYVEAVYAKCRVVPNRTPEAQCPSAHPTTFPDRSVIAPETITLAAGQVLSPGPSRMLPDAKLSAVGREPFDGQSIGEPKATCTTAGRHFRHIYDTARIHYAAHPDWTDGHKHNAALRKVGKEILRDLWEIIR